MILDDASFRHDASVMSSLMEAALAGGGDGGGDASLCSAVCRRIVSTTLCTRRSLPNSPVQQNTGGDDKIDTYTNRYKIYLVHNLFFKIKKINYFNIINK